jgi:chromosome segregation ATPase
MSTPLSPSLEAQHQREIIRLHELWQQTKRELADAREELAVRQPTGGGSGQRDKAMAQMQALTTELRDKCRFTELQLAGAREETSKFSASCDEMRTMLSTAQAQLVEAQTANQQHQPMLTELRGANERLQREKQVLVDQIHQEQQRTESVLASKQHLLQLQEQKLAAVSDDLRRTLESQSGAAAATDAAQARISELERTNGELEKQLMHSKEQLKSATAPCPPAS